ncbi:MAG: DNA polymerase I [Spirochaetaceae bacterium]|jgi:DNA polymerase-1|nr:DNA polymerase I [Spirochaetaceae bacterium]
MQPLYLIDAYGLIYRCYFAFIARPLRNSQGKNVSALFGFARAIAGLINERNPQYMAAVFDSRKPTFRHELYAEYKANRQKAPDDLHEQVPLVEEMLAALGVHGLRKDGFEADDIIATLAVRCRKEGRPCYIVSSDKDLLQLVGDGVYELRPSRDAGRSYDVVDEAGVKAKWGVSPERMLDLLSLMGDASDNIPGVKGIGEKTATKLIARYGSLDEIYQNIAGIEGSNGQKLAEGKESALLSRKLVALRHDVELPIASLEALSVQHLNGALANTVLKREEIRDVRFKEDKNKSGSVLVKTGEVEAETSILSAKDALQTAGRDGVLFLSPAALHTVTPDVIAGIKAFVSNPKNTVVSADIKELYKLTRRAGVPRWQCALVDTSILTWLGNPDSGPGQLKRSGDGQYDPRAGLPEIYTKIEAPLIPILAEMELRGIKIEKSSLAAYSAELAAEFNTIQAEIFKLAGHEFKIGSSKQLGEVLFVERGLKPSKKTKSGYSTDAEVLEDLSREDPIPALVLRFRLLSKLASTYVDTLPHQTDENDRIHTTFVQTGTATGRLSSRDPNLQNIPIREAEGRRIRAAFIAEKGNVLVSADYSQIELAVLAHFSEDKNLIESFAEGKDVHRRTAALILGKAESEVTPDERRMSKVINFGVIYGMSAYRLGNELGISRPEAASFIESYFNTYAGVRDFMRSLIDKAEKDGYVETLFGRRRYIADINSPNKTVKSSAERIAVNTPIQGTAADIVKIAMINLDKALSGTEGTQAAILLQVHDELILECPEESASETAVLVKQVMETSTPLRVPLRVSVEHGTRWGNFH